jgi:hypothetical protein
VRTQLDDRCAALLARLREISVEPSVLTLVRDERRAAAKRLLLVR